MQISGIDVDILVKKRAISKFQHDNKTYIEGRSGSNYEIEVRSHRADRVEAVISVDGLSVVDGAAAGIHSRGYLIEPFGKIVIPGWMLDHSKVAKFAFAGGQDSYATLASAGTSTNNGVIGVMVFAAKQYARPAPSMPRGITPGIDSWSGHARVNPSAGSWSGSSIGSSGYTANAIYSQNAMSVSSTSYAPPTQTLGTQFGAPAAFSTTTVSFERGEQVAVISLFYDDMAGLRARGVPVTRRRRKLIPAQQPVAFPASPGCVPPPGW